MRKRCKLMYLASDMLILNMSVDSILFVFLPRSTNLARSDYIILQFSLMFEIMVCFNTEKVSNDSKDFLLTKIMFILHQSALFA